MSLDLLSQDWDAIVIGTGMGGGTIGRVLAEGGLRVLFVEKGPRGHRSERQALHSEVFTPEALEDVMEEADQRARALNDVAQPARALLPSAMSRFNVRKMSNNVKLPDKQSKMPWKQIASVDCKLRRVSSRQVSLHSAEVAAGAFAGAFGGAAWAPPHRTRVTSRAGQDARSMGLC